LFVALSKVRVGVGVGLVSVDGVVMGGGGGKREVVALMMVVVVSDVHVNDTACCALSYKASGM
jgi:hypothetical protein